MAATAAAAALLVAIVAEDPVVLRNAPRDDAPAQATLWRGDWLEVRGETAGFLKVYDHRHERPGYLRPNVARVHRLDEATAPELRAVVRFLRDAGGSESLGIGYAALYLRAAPAGSDPSEVFAAIGTMAARLARRASARRADGRDQAGGAPVSAAAAEREVAESYGVHFNVLEATTTGGRAHLCYDGEAWGQVLASPSPAPVERARAALFLAGQGSSPECLDATAAGTATGALGENRSALNDRRIQALESVDTAALAPSLAGRVRLARARALAWRAFDQTRRQGAAGSEAATRAAAAAVRELALAGDKGVLAPEDEALRDDVTVRVAASRWAAEPQPPVTAGTPAERSRRATVAVVPRAPGESCLRVLEPGGPGGAPRVAGERCTYGIIWPGALRWSRSGKAATIAVQPLPAWTELWVLRRDELAAGTTTAAAMWSIEPLTPGAVEPDVGYVEAAGFSPDGDHLLVVREARAAGVAQRWFQVLALATLGVEKQAHAMDKLVAFKKWSAPSWHAGTLALR